MNVSKGKIKALSLLVFTSLVLFPARGVLAETSTAVQDQVLLLKTLNQTTEQSSHMVHRFFLSMGFSNPHSQNYEVKIFNDHQEMLSQTPHHVALDASALGYYEHDTHKIAVWYGGNLPETQRILRHEIIHKGLHQSLGFAPPAWLDEGFAELLSRDEKALRVAKPNGLPTLVKDVLKGAKDNGNLMELSELFQFDHSNFYNQNQEVHYALSYTVIAYLLDQEGSRVLGNLIQAIQNGEEVSNWLQKRVFGESIDADQKILEWALNS